MPLHFCCTSFLQSSCLLKITVIPPLVYFFIIVAVYYLDDCVLCFQVKSHNNSLQGTNCPGFSALVFDQGSDEEEPKSTTPNFTFTDKDKRVVSISNWVQSAIIIFTGHWPAHIDTVRKSCVFASSSKLLSRFIRWKNYRSGQNHFWSGSRRPWPKPLKKFRRTSILISTVKWVLLISIQ